MTIPAVRLRTIVLLAALCACLAAPRPTAADPGDESLFSQAVSAPAWSPRIRFPAYHEDDLPRPRATTAERSSDEPSPLRYASIRDLVDAPSPLSDGPGVPGWGDAGSRSPNETPVDWRSLLQQALVRSSFESTWLPQQGDGPEMVDVQGNVSLGTPGSTYQQALILTPGYGVHWWSGETGSPLPAQVYDFYLDVYFRKEVGAWVFDAAVTPGYYSDLEKGDSKGLRTFGRLIANYQWSEKMTLAFGVAYLDREEYNILPVFGSVWKPRDGLIIEGMVPRPRIAVRVVQRGEESGWAYLGGEVGGGRWAVQYEDGAVDRLNYMDYRIVGGFEWRTDRRTVWKGEVGYVFGREFEREDVGRIWDVEDTFMSRLGFVY